MIIAVPQVVRFPLVRTRPPMSLRAPHRRDPRGERTTEPPLTRQRGGLEQRRDPRQGYRFWSALRRYQPDGRSPPLGQGSR